MSQSTLAADIRAYAAQRYMALDATQRSHLRWLCGAAALYAVHFAVWCWPQPFFIEDSAISFSYARNFVEGKGWVPFPGGERVEGYSNFLWTLLIGVVYLLGLQPWYSAKILGFLFGIITLFLSYGIARRVQGEGQEAGVSWAPVVPAYLLACSTQFVLWNASGLENSLFNLMLALGIYLTIRESEEDRFVPLSALAWLGLALTRPEGMAYAAVGLLARVCITLWRGGFSSISLHLPVFGSSSKTSSKDEPTSKDEPISKDELQLAAAPLRRLPHWVALVLWLVLMVVPFGLYQLWRYEYFAWLWPNTFYAKEKSFKPYNWGGGGWPKFREYMHIYGIVYASPAILLGLTGFSRWRRIVGAGLLVIMAVFLLWDGKAGIPPVLTGSATRYLSIHWSEWRVKYMLGAAIWLGLQTMGWKGWEARTLLWATYCTGLFFQIFSGGDWMKGYRWFSLTSVPQFILLGVGIGLLSDLVPAAKAKLYGVVNQEWAYGFSMVLILGALNVPQSYDFAIDAETAVRDVHQRVRYMSGVQRKLGLDSVALLDVDMGAHMWYTDWYILDIAGLIDVPVARHDWQKAFSEDYLLSEYRPEYAHVHGAWARSTKITDLAGFKSDYVEIPGFPSGGRTLHVGNHIRKDLIVRPSYEGPQGRSVQFGADEAGFGGIVLDGWELPAAEVAAGGRLYLASSWSAGVQAEGAAYQKPNDFRVQVVLSNAAGTMHVVEVVPAYDWYAASKWKEGEHVLGNWGIPLPESMEDGAWEVRIALIESKSGKMLAASSPAAQPRFMVGEVLLSEGFEVVSFKKAHDRAEAVLKAGLEAGEAGDCAGLELAWKNARRHVARDAVWHQEQEARYAEGMVGCLISRANQTQDPEEKAPFFMQAQRLLGQLDRSDSRLIEAVTPVGATLEAIGDSRAAEQDWEGAFRAFSAAVKVDPRRSWARRKAEECRDYRLKLKPKVFTGEKPLFPH
jgi:hypothetical protein